MIAKAGKPLVRVTGLDAPAEPRRLGFLSGEIDVPKDFTDWSNPCFWTGVLDSHRAEQPANQ